jgi:hypothetical protein
MSSLVKIIFGALTDFVRRATSSETQILYPTRPFLEIFPPEIIVEIFKNLEWKEQVKKEIVCKSFLHIVRTTKWDHFIISLQNIKIIDKVVNNYNFAKYDFSFSAITDDIVKSLAKLGDLTCPKGDKVKLLTNCHTLDLSYCTKITDNSVKMLGNCHILNLTGCCAV